MKHDQVGLAAIVLIARYAPSPKNTAETNPPLLTQSGRQLVDRLVLGPQEFNSEAIDALIASLSTLK